MTVAIHSGPARVIDNGYVTAFFGQPLRFTLPLTAETNFFVELSFTTDPTQSDVAIQANPSAQGLSLHLSNFDDAAGRGSAVPVLLGEWSEHLWFFHFRVFRFGKTDDRTVHYTFFRVAKDAVDWTPEAPPPMP